MDAAVAQTLFLAGCLSSLLILFIRKTMYQRDKLPPGPTPLPFIGNLLQINTNGTAKGLIKMSEKYGPVFRVYIGPEMTVILSGYEAVKEALIDQAEVFGGRGNMETFNHFFFFQGIAFSNGEIWKQTRQFSVMTLKDFGVGKRGIQERIQEEAQFLVENLRKTKELSIDPNFFFSQAVSNVICSIVFGNRFDYDDKEYLHLLQMIDEIFCGISSIWGQLFDIFTSIMKHLPGPHNRIRRCFEVLEEYIAKKVKQNQETLDLNSPRDFIDSFLIKVEQEKQNSSSYFHVKNLIATVLILFFAGTEPPTTTLRYAFLILLKHPEVEERLHQEIDHVIGRQHSPCHEDRNKMPYTNAVIHEIQRFIGLVPLNVPHKVTQDTHFRGYMIPKGTRVRPMLYSVLHDPSQFSHPENFNPGHFLDERGNFKKSDAFLPFSAGKRMCMGEGLARVELFVFFVSILQNFSLKSNTPPKDIDISPAVSNFGNIPHLYEISFVPR
ncbi:cytochrome P450 2A13-like isoform X2 [Microcaecilia unicolor]|uniref:Cytochrome P450 2A13-like isoform X2 n=1 Tax=Microcaecilia unicolor TaxID=1415580 RepID=A0A6P7Z2Q0_9AMPH|nr:cytochrome P450 2A13-like isoform X2 [Microcaecilia unicolor]